MLHYYLSPWAGDGRQVDYRPVIGAAAEEAGAAWWCIDLRPNSTVTEGRALVACSARPGSTPGCRYLGEDPDTTLSAQGRRQLGNELSLTLTRPDPTLRRVVIELLADHGRRDGTRWRPLQPLTRGPRSWEVWLGGLLWSTPRVAGGATHTESFTGSNNTIGAATIDLTWADVDSGWSVVANAAALTSDGVAYARAQHDTASADTYAQATLITKVDVGADYAQFSPLTRFASGATTCYMACRGQDQTTDFRARKTEGGARSNLASAVTVAVSLPEVVRIEANGSTIRGLIDGTQHIAVTDTSIPAGTRGGIYGYRPSGGGAVTVDSFSCGDLSTVITGALSAVAPLGAAQFSGAVTTAGELSATGPLPVVSAAGAVVNPGVLDATGPLPVAGFTGVVVSGGSLAASAPPAAVVLSGVVVVPGQLDAVAPAVRAAFSDEVPPEVGPWPPVAGSVQVSGVAGATVRVSGAVTSTVTVQ